MRDLLEHVLRSLGYTVLPAHNGMAALLVVERHEGPIHLIMTDIVMPKMGGQELAERMALLGNEMPVLYITGHDDTIVTNQGVVDVRERLLRKPFRLKDVAEKVREVLDQPVPSR